MQRTVLVREMSLAFMMAGLVLMLLALAKEHAVFSVIVSCIAFISEFVCFWFVWGELLLLGVAFCMYSIIVYIAFLRKKKKVQEEPEPEDIALDLGEDSFVLDEPMQRHIYEKLVDVMEKDKPYLDDEFTLYDLSLKVYTNRTYVSKTINAMTGKNFRRFVNEYRIRYSITLIEEDHTLRVSDLAAMSGFHNRSTFNVAFKLYSGCTPGEYIHRLKLKGRPIGEDMQLFPEESFLPDVQG